VVAETQKAQAAKSIIDEGFAARSGKRAANKEAEG
jgi:hypothetical protein